MARLKSQSDSDDDFPDIATLLKKPARQYTAAKRTTAPTPRTVRKPRTKVVETEETKENDLTSSVLKPKITPANPQPRRQRPLNSLKSANSLQGRFKQPSPEIAIAKEQAIVPPEHTSQPRTAKETPRRTAKKAVTYRPATPPSPIESEEEKEGDHEPTYISESEEEIDDTVIEEEFWDEPKTVRKASKPPARSKTQTERDKRADKGPEGFKESVPFVDLISPEKPSQAFPQLKPFAPIPSLQPNLRPGTAGSSSSVDYNAILRFEPPTRSPHKLPNILRPVTPPAPSSPSKGKLVSPSKIKAARIPTPPHKEDINAFWDHGEINTWNEQHSPRKIIASPRKKKLLEELFGDDTDDGYQSPSESPKKGTRSPVKGSPTKQDKEMKQAKKNFEARKQTLATDFLQELDQKITQGKIAELTAETGGVGIVWSKKLNSTAGRAHWKRETVRLYGTEKGVDGKPYRWKHRAHIELAEKVIDDEDRLLNVLAHEFCHLATFMVSGVKDNPHGKEFKGWGTKVSRAFSDRNITVTTKHSYDISYKYIWECVECGHEYKRHSKSIDPAKHACGSCKSKLVQTKPAARAAGQQSDYRIFVKENFQRVKKENPGLALGGCMEILGREYRERKAHAGGNVDVKAVVKSKKTSGGLDDLVKGLEVITLDD